MSVPAAAWIVVGREDGNVAMRLLDGEGRELSRRSVEEAAFADEVRRVEGELSPPRWVWSDTPTWYDALLDRVDILGMGVRMDLAIRHSDQLADGLEAVVQHHRAVGEEETPLPVLRIDEVRHMIDHRLQPFIAFDELGMLAAQRGNHVFEVAGGVECRCWRGCRLLCHCRGLTDFDRTIKTTSYATMKEIRPFWRVWLRTNVASTDTR